MQNRENDIEFRIAKKNLPTELNDEQRINLIFDTFCNHEIQITEKLNSYILKLQRSPFLYCEDQQSIIDTFGLNEYDVMNYFAVNDDNIFCFLESWIPYGWSCYFSKKNTPSKKITVIHFDDHADLMSPQIGINENDEWLDLLTNKKIDFLYSDSVKSAIESGAITIGSILTILVYFCNSVKILHFKQKVDTIERKLTKCPETKSHLSTKYKIMAIKLIDKNSYSENNSDYLRSSDINEIIENIPEDGEIFLHIDMDFLNNRFNGSTDYKFDIIHDSKIEEQRFIIQSICKAISRADLLGRIVHISIGLSPSFYPSEFWRAGLNLLIAELENINLKNVPQVCL